MDEDNQRKTLVLKEEDVEIDSTSTEVKTFSEPNGLVNYIQDNYKVCDLFDVYMHGRYVHLLVASTVWRFPQVKRITFSYDSINDLNEAKRRIGMISGKFQFCLKNEVANRIQNNHHFLNYIFKYPHSQKTLKLKIEERMHQLQMKQQNLIMPETYISPIPMLGFNARNIKSINSMYICLLCSYILRDPVQLQCGHRVCRSCMDNQKYYGRTNICPKCRTEINEKKVLLDIGFKHDMETLNIDCSFCNWNGQLQEYSDHLAQYHPNPTCEYCDAMFESSEHLLVHQMNNCHMIIEPCLLADYGCSKTVNRLEKENHYRTEEHQHALINAIHHLSNNKSDVQHENDAKLGLNQITEIFVDATRTLNNDLKSISDESSRLKDAVDNLTRNILSLRPDSIIQSVHMKKSEGQLRGLLKEVELLRENIDMTPVSYDGTLVWRITNFLEIMSDARSGRQTSIYSPSFCSSETGYMMRCCLFPLGDGNARGTHMSLFFILMKSKNDAILKFPFDYKVTFYLFDQADKQNPIIDSFRPDTKSDSFQQPRSKMNTPSGIPKFCPLEKIIGDKSPYIRDDIMFIKITVDFSNLSDDIQHYALNLNPGLPTHKQYELIQQEIEKRTQHQSTT